MGRQPYTPAGFDDMKKRLARAAIERWVYDKAWRENEFGDPCLQGSADQGFWFSLRHTPSAHVAGDTGGDDPERMYHYRLPPVDAKYAGSRPYVEDENGQLLPHPVQDFWTEVYRSYFDWVDEVFEGWDELPDERRFWDCAESLREAVRPIHLDLATVGGNPYELGGDGGIVDSLRDLGSSLTDPFGTMTGHTVSTFRDTYVRPLDVLVAQQHGLAELAAGLLHAEGRMWQRARTTVMEIGEQAVVAMGPEQASVQGVVQVLGNVADALQWVPGPVGRVAEVMGRGLDFIQLWWKKHPPPEDRAVTLGLSGATSTDVLVKVGEALAELNRQIMDEELAVNQGGVAAADATYQPSRLIAPSGEYEVYFNLPPPSMLAESDAEAIAADIAVNFSQLRRAAATMPVIAGYLDRAAGDAGAADPGVAAWMRPSFIGVPEPHHGWTALHQRLVWVLSDTAGELRAAGEHLSLAVDALERADEQSRAALEQHTRDVAPIAAPDPTPRLDRPTA